MEWGVSDCTMFVADWVAWLDARDPASDLRGTYESREGAQCVIASGGGLPALFDRAGWEPVAKPEAGDIAVIVARRFPLRSVEMARPRGAVCTGDMWAVKGSPWGVFVARKGMFRPLKVWRRA